MTDVILIDRDKFRDDVLAKLEEYDKKISDEKDYYLKVKKAAVAEAICEMALLIANNCIIEKWN